MPIKTWIFSDTHGLHNELTVPNNIELAIFCGDCSNQRDPTKNLPEVTSFMQWYSSLNIPRKIMIAGNHDTSIERRWINFDLYNVIYLEHQCTEIFKLKIFGSPYTPFFNNWAFNKKRNKLTEYWKQIPEDIDIVITHGPPKFISDLTYDYNGKLERVGDKALLNRVIETNPKIHCYGHLHNEKNIYNSGIYKNIIPEIETTFINASVSNIGYKLINHGYIIYI